MSQKLAAWLFAQWGWKITGRFPKEVPKFVIAVAPHTSNWDFPVGVFTRAVLGGPIKWAGKHTLFNWPLGILMRWLGGVPVDRRRSNNFVEATIKVFENHDRLWLTIAPEGHRKRVDKFKTGFYYIAKGAKIPILLCKFDWEKREVHFDPQLFWPGDDARRDLDFLWNYFKGVPGRVPENGVF